MHLEYTVEKQELLESLHCLQWKKEGVRKLIHVCILTLLGCYCMYIYYREPENIMAFFLSILIISVLLMVLYLPGLKRKKKAAEILKYGRKCAVDFPIEGLQYVFTTDQVITLQMEHAFYCIPKRVLGPQKQAYLEKNVFPNAKKIVEVTL